jgi:hypothetical protein
LDAGTNNNASVGAVNCEFWAVTALVITPSKGLPISQWCTHDQRSWLPLQVSPAKSHGSGKKIIVHEAVPRSGVHQWPARPHGGRLY